MKSKHLFLYLPCFFFASCASIVSKSAWPVTFNSNPSGAKVVVKKEDGTLVHQGVTPTTVTLPASGGYFKSAKYVVQFDKKGHPSQTLHVAAELNGWYMGNILLGGLIGMLIVDPATGAMWKLDETVTANLNPVATIEGGNGRKLHVVDRSSLTADQQKNLVAIN